MDFRTVRDSIPEGATKPGGVALVCAWARLVGKPEVIPPTVADLVLRRSASNSINTRMLHTRDLADEQWQTLDPPIPRPRKRRDGPRATLEKPPVRPERRSVGLTDWRTLGGPPRPIPLVPDLL